MNLRYILYLLLISLHLNIYSQAEETNHVKQKLEKYIENSESTTDFTDLLEQLDYYLNHPININTAGYNELIKLPFLSPENIMDIISHRKQYGDFINIYELQTLQSFTPDKIQLLIPFIYIKNKTLLYIEPSHELTIFQIRKIEKSQGYLLPDTNRNKFLGNTWRQAIKYKGQLSDELSFYCNIEKDAGENYQVQNLFYSGGILYKNNKKQNSLIQQLIIGDFQTSFGQGLTLSSGLTFGKSPMVINTLRTQNGFRKYNSFNENAFLRGIASQLRLHKNLTMHTFYSSLKIDANLYNDTLSLFSGFTSLPNTGYHRNITEIQSMRKNKQQVLGNNFTYTKNGLMLGLTTIYTQFEQLKQNTNLPPYQLFQFHGKSYWSSGLNYRYLYKNCILFGEANYSEFKYLSLQQGIILSLGKRIDISILYRKYHRSATTLLSKAFGESSTTQNEQGIYTGVTISPYQNYQLNAYLDIYTFPWLRYRTDAPSAGKDALIELQYNKRKQYNWYLRYRSETKQNNITSFQPMHSIDNYTRQQLRFNIDWLQNQKISFGTRCEHIWYTGANSNISNGILLFQEIALQANRKIKLSGRYVYFDTDNYYSRIYTFESQLPYIFYVPSFQDKGTRYYIQLKYKALKELSFYLRFAHTKYFNKNSIGSGVNLINSNQLNEISIMLQWKINK